MIWQKIARAEMATRNVIGPSVVNHFDALYAMDEPVMPDDLTIEQNLVIHKLRKSIAKGPRPQEQGVNFSVPKLDPRSGRWKHNIKREKVMKEIKYKSDASYLKGLIMVLDDLREDPDENTEDGMINGAKSALDFIRNREIFWAQQEVPDVPAEFRNIDQPVDSVSDVSLSMGVCLKF